MSEKYRFAIYGFAAGIVIGILVATTFSALLRIALLFLLIVPFVVAYGLWQRSRKPARPREKDIPEATWRDLG